MKFKRLVAGGLAGAAALTLSVLLPSEANADVINGCPSDRLCAWEDSMYSGRLQVTDIRNEAAFYETKYGDKGYGHGHSDIRVSSYWNRTNLSLCATDGRAHDMMKIVPGEQSAVLSSSWNDNIAAVTPNGKGASCDGL